MCPGHHGPPPRWCRQDYKATASPAAMICRKAAAMAPPPRLTPAGSRVVGPSATVSAVSLAPAPRKEQVNGPLAPQSLRVDGPRATDCGNAAMGTPGPIAGTTDLPGSGARHEAAWRRARAGLADRL